MNKSTENFGIDVSIDVFETSIIAFRILYTLEERGMTQKDLAEKMGKSPQWINKIVKGQQNLTIGTLKELEAALGIGLFQIP